MSVSSIATLLVSAPVTPPPSVKAAGTADAPHATRFAQILSRGKVTEGSAQDSAKTGKAETAQQDDTDSSAETPPTLAADSANIAASPVDLDAAASEGVSAVLALIGTAPPPPAPPAPAAASGTDMVADVTPTGAAMPARLLVPTQSSPDLSATDAPVIPETPASTQLPAPAIAAPPAPTSEATTTVTPSVAPKVAQSVTPTAITNLSPADLQLLRSITAGPPPEIKPQAGDAAAAITTAAASEPAISPMAKALNQAFSPTQQSATAPTPQAIATQAAADPGASASALSPTPLPAADATSGTDKPAARHAASSGDDVLPAPDAAPVAAGDTPAPAFSLPGSDTSIRAADLTAATPGVAPSHAEQSVTRHIDMLHDTQWLDRLAQDISQAAAQNGHLKFQINPEHLGSLAVEITNGAAGASIRMTTDNDNARAIIADAQPRLLAEVRAQGLRIAESHVDMGNQPSSGNSANHRPSSEDHKPFVRTQVGVSEEPGDSAPRDDELYA
jgi:flagellar hook-length control protein FliK